MISWPFVYHMALETMRETHPTITFEQPMNEYIRACLRLEKLFLQLKDAMRSQAQSSSREALLALLKILEVINRPDLKSKLTQALTQHACTLGQLEQFPQVDAKRLRSVLEMLDRHIDVLHKSQRKIAEPLQNNEFLNQMRLQMGSPGGINDEKVPAYHLWLNQTPEKRAEDLHRWANQLKPLNEIVDLLLQLMRDSTEPQSVQCKEGLYHQTLDPNLPYELIRITLPNADCYPEISVGKHRLVIRVKKADFHDPTQSNQIKSDLELKLSCCRL